MPAGIQIINDSGTILIDENYANLAVRTKLTRTANGAITPSSPSTPVAVFRDSTLASVFKFAGNANFVLIKEAATTATIWIFDKPVAPVANYGFQVFDAAGNCTFDALQQYARVVDVFSGNTPAQWSGTRTYPSGRTYAVALLKRPWRTDWEIRDDAGGGGYYNTRQRFVYAGARIDGNKVITAELPGPWGIWSLPIQNPSPPPLGYLNPDTVATFAVIDVTGY